MHYQPRFYSFIVVFPQQQQESIVLLVRLGEQLLADAVLVLSGGLLEEGGLAFVLGPIQFLLHEPHQQQSDQEHAEAEGESARRLPLRLALHDQRQEDAQQKPSEIAHREQQPRRGALADWEGGFAGEFEHDGDEGDEEEGVVGGDEAGEREYAGFEERVEDGHGGAGTYLGEYLPTMQMRMNFLNFLLLRCIGPITITPMIPLTTGLPPTNPTASARLPENHGFSRQDRMIDRPLKMPKQHPKATSKSTKFLLRKSLASAIEKGSRLRLPDSEAGVGGRLCWKAMLGRQQRKAMTASTSITLKVCRLPSVMSFSVMGSSTLQPPKTMPGMKMPMMRETLRTRVSSCVMPPRFSAVNQLAEILAWQLRMKGRPMPATTCPTITHAKEWLTSMRRQAPRRQSALPTAIPSLVPQVSMTQAAGKVKTGCMRVNSRAPRFIMSGSCPQIDSRYLAMGVSVLIRIDVIICASENSSTITWRFGYILNSAGGESAYIVLYYNQLCKKTKIGHPGRGHISGDAQLQSTPGASIQYTIVQMLELFSLDDNKKIGMLLLVIAAFLYFFGLLLFFARSLLLLSNLFFLAGLYFFIGFAGLFKFFAKKGKIRGSLAYFAGLLLIVGNFGFFGAVAQVAGILMIFRTFLPDLYDYVTRIPVVGKHLKSYWLQNSLEKLAGTSNRI